MEPRALVNELKTTHGVSSDVIAKRVGCSKEYVDKMASGARNNPSYRIVDSLREMYQELQLTN